MRCYCGQEVDRPHHLCTIEQLRRDRIIGGSSFGIRHDDGTIERLDPTKVVVGTFDVLSTDPVVERRVPVLYLDIDGTVREGVDDPLGRFVNGPDDVRVFPEAVTMMRRWKDKGGRIIGVSNQGGIALGHMTIEDCEAAMLETQVQTGGLFDLIAFCRHHPAVDDPEYGRCWCRKPRPGLIIEGALTLAARYPGELYPPHLALMVGDRDEDLDAADAANLPFQRASKWRAAAL